MNRIKVTFQPDLNDPDVYYHYDNVIAIVCTPNATNLESGTMLSFQDFAFSKDLNVINSNSDGLDMDFSSITIDQLFIDNSLNDCADFSFGNYFINNAK